MADTKTGFIAYVIAGREIRCSTVHGKCLLQYYCSNASKEGTFFKSTLDICYETKLAESTVRRLNDGLKKLEVLSWVEGNGYKGKANTYTLNLTNLQAMAEKSRTHRDPTKEKMRRQSAERARRFRANHPDITPPVSVTEK